MHGEKDEYYISKVLNGDTSAFSYLVDRYSEMVFSISLRLLKNRTLAEDNAQEVFISVYEKLAKFKKKSQFSTWLYRITYNQAISKLRKQNKVAVTDNDGYLEAISKHTVDEENNADAINSLNRAIKSLSPENQVIIMLHYYKDESIENVAKITGLSVSNVKVKLHRLRKKLKLAMEEFNEKEALGII